MPRLSSDGSLEECDDDDTFDWWLLTHGSFESEIRGKELALTQVQEAAYLRTLVKRQHLADRKLRALGYSEGLLLSGELLRRRFAEASSPLYLAGGLLVCAALIASSWYPAIVGLVLVGTSLAVSWVHRRLAASLSRRAENVARDLEGIRKEAALALPDALCRLPDEPLDLQGLLLDRIAVRRDALDFATSDKSGDAPEQRCLPLSQRD